MYADTLVSHKALLIFSAIYAAAACFPTTASAARGKRIWRLLSEGLNVKIGYIAAAVHSFADHRMAVTICFLRLTVCHSWVWEQVIPEATMVVMLGPSLIGSFALVTAGLGGGWTYTTERVVVCFV